MIFMSNQQFYPPVTDIIKLENIPAQLGFIQNGINSLFENLYFRDLQYTRGKNDDSAFYSLTLISYKKLGVEIPGTGILMVLNPDHNPAAGFTAIPISLHYEWKILRFVKGFNLQQFSFDGPGFFNLLVKIIDVAPQQLVLEAINQYAGSEINNFIDDINSKYGLELPYPETDALEEGIQEVIDQVEAFTGLPILTLLFPLYLFDEASDSNTQQKIEKLFQTILGGVSAIEFLKAMLIPKIDASLQLGIGLEFPRSILIPLDETPGATYGKPLPEPAVSKLIFQPGSFRFNTEGGIGYDQELSTSFPFSQIGSTGLTLKVESAKLDISTTTNLAEVDADGRPKEFVGVYIKEAEIGLPQFWNKNANGSTAKIVGNNLIMGTGGFSGSIGLKAVSAQGAEDLLLNTSVGGANGFNIGLSSFDISIRQNSITGSSIKGLLTIPGFKDKATNQPAKIGVGINIGNDTFDVTASMASGLVLSLDSILEITVNSLSLGKDQDKFYIAVSGSLQLIAKAPGSNDPLLPVKIDVKKLLIYEDGSFEFVGGVSLLQEAISLKLGPVELTVTALTFGTYEQFHGNKMRKYAYFGFDGGLSLDPVGVDARGDGIKFYFTVDNDPLHTFMRIDSIGIDLVIPGTADASTAALLLSGYLSMKQPDPPNPNAEANTEYMGGVTFSLPKLGLAGSAAMRLNPKVPAFIIDVGLELPVPILLGATGLGIYGFRGVVGNAYVPSKAAAQVPEDEPWWVYYKKKLPPTNKEGVQINKFEQKDGFSIGAGASLATAPDAGKSFSSKLFFLLGLPDIFLLQGQAAIMRERIGLDTTTDPPFYALIAITSSSVEAAFGVNYKIPEPGGEILQLDGVLEMGFFFKNAGAWYINVGRDQPENKRIKAKILTLFEGYSYLMLSSKGIKAGAGVNWDFNKHYGPVGIEVGCYLDMGGFVSFKPVQVGGFISMGGYARVVVFGFKFGFDVSASLAAEAPKPFIVTGKFKLTINLFWPFDDIAVEVALTWVINNQLNLDEISLLDTTQMDKKSPASAVNLATKGSFLLNYMPPSTSASIAPPTAQGWADIFDKFTIPMDSRVDIEFIKPVKPGGSRLEGIVQGYEYSEYVAPQKAKSEQIRHDFVVEDVKILYWDPVANIWKNFEVYDANTPLKDIAQVNQDILNKGPYGYWQMGETPNKFTKLSILSLSPFSYITQGTPGNVTPEQLGYPETVLLCSDEEIKMTCQNWEGNYFATIIPPDKWFQDRELLYRIYSQKPLILPTSNSFGLNYGVKVGNAEKMEVVFVTPMAEVGLTVSSMAPSVKFVFYKKQKMQQNPLEFEYLKVSEVIADQQILEKPVNYKNVAEPIDMVEISSYNCKPGDSSNKGEILFLEWAKAELQKLTDLYTNYSNLIAELEILCSRKTRNYDKWHLLEQKYGIDLWDNPCEQIPELQETCNKYRNEANSIKDYLAGLDKEESGQTSENPPKENRESDDIPHPTDDIEIPTVNVYTCATFVHQICWLTLKDSMFNLTIPGQSEVKGKNEAMVESMQKIIQPIWRPNTHYAIQVQTLDDLYADNNSVMKYRKYYNFGFKTTGGIGHFHQFRNSANNRVLRNDYSVLKTNNKEDEYKLANLKHYIDYDRSYPNADGNLINAKPLFYKEAKLLLFYKFPYVYSMFSNWDSYNGLGKIEASLEVVIKDPAAHKTQSNDIQQGVWEVNNLGIKEEEFNIIENLIINGANCSGLQGPLSKPAMNTAVKPEYLKPSKLYTALFTAKTKYQANGETDSNEVHKYNFQTSRYADFQEQVLSYKLNVNNQVSNAVYTIEQSINVAELQLIKDIIQENNSATHKALQVQFAQRLERLMNGALKLAPLNAASSTEFNIIKNSVNGDLTGVLIRNPEPFNDPKLPKNLVATSILCKLTPKGSNNPNDVVTNFDKVFSNDISAVFITNSQLNLPPGILEINFTYFEYNGEAYESVDQCKAIIEIE
jgi:hypothetical protein